MEDLSPQLGRDTLLKEDVDRPAAELLLCMLQQGDKTEIGREDVKYTQ